MGRGAGVTAAAFHGAPPAAGAAGAAVQLALRSRRACHSDWSRELAPGPGSVDA